MTEPREAEGQYANVSRWYYAALGFLFLLNVLLGFVQAPRVALAGIPIEAVLGFAAGIVYIATPLAGLFAAASGQWSWKKDLALLIGGVAVQAASAVGLSFLPHSGAITVLVQALGQTGLLLWCAGLGFLVSHLFREKNIIVPVCIFLAGFDAWLIFNPYVFTSQLVESNSKIFQTVAMKVPQPKVVPQPGAKPEDKEPRIVPLANIGPADLIFSATFFAVLYRFRMRVKESLRWLIPVLILYLALVFLAPGGMLPALVPIGMTILLVNRKEFNLSGEEKQAVWVVAAVALGLAGFGIYSRITYKPKARPAAPSSSAPVPGTPGSPGSPKPASPGQSPS